MQTTKTISTISFNTPDFLKSKLETLQKSRIVSFWAFVVHQPEDDEGGKKEHIHLFVEPSKRINTDDLTQALIEIDPNNVKPRKCISWCFSKFDDWCMYSLHDKAYLSAKNESRKYHYRYEHIITSDEDDLLSRYRRIDLTAITPYRAIVDAQNQGISFAEYVAMGKVPIPQIKAVEYAWRLIWDERTERAGRENHEMDCVVDENGEVIESSIPDDELPD